VKKNISSFVLLLCLMVVFSSCAFGQGQSTEDLKALNAKLEKLFRQGNYSAAMPVAENIRTITEQRYGPDHVETANALNNLILVYIEQKRYDEAEKLSKRALEIYERQLGNDRLCAAMINNYLAEIFEETNRQDEAIKAKDKAREVERQVPPEEKVICGAMEPLVTLGSTGEGPDQPVPPPPPPPLTRAPRGEPAIAFWNTWLENLANGNRVEELETGNIYSFVLDISRFSYFEKYSASVDPSVQKVVSDALERGDKKIRFTIRPILHGDTIRFADNQPTSLALNVDLGRLAKPTDQAADKRIEQEKEKLKLCDFAHEVQAGEVRFDLLAERSGDATIFITIWDDTGKIPLDHMSVSVQVIDATTPVNKRRPVSVTFPLKAGRQTLLDISSDFSTAGPLIADAAFYIFEKSPNRKSMVFFAAKKDAATPGAPEEVSVYAWETISLLSNYVEGRQLIKLIRDAREKATSRDENVRKYSYQLVAEELREKIFSGFNKRDQEQAADAEKVFRDLVRRKDQASIVFARMRNEDRNPIYLPLGILAASSSSRILEKRIILVQPLPRERYPAGTHPVNTWTFNVPNNLPELEDPTNTALSKLQKNPPYRRDIASVRAYFEEIVSPASGVSPEGVMLLSHQAGGNLWFTNETDHITTEKIKRQFPAGSVAILSACSAAASEGNNQDILERLNHNGIDAMVISPFPVDAEYGAVLAIQFVQAIENAKEHSQTFSVAEVFSMASEQTAKHFKENQKINFEDMDLEFLIAGDYRIRIGTPKND
jgi:tetratricopeptide (TPR) repeat protein